MSYKSRILIVDDDQNIRRILKLALENCNYDILLAENCESGLSELANSNPDLVILDLGLPDLDGSEFIKRAITMSKAPIIVLSANGEEHKKVNLLDLGAHDYVTKPFSMPELIARIKVALRVRSGDSINPIFEASGIKIDFAQHQVVLNGLLLHLTPLEYKMLCLLAQNRGRVITHKQAISEVWGAAYLKQTHYVRILMKSLRHKIETDPARPRILITESGVGYRFNAD